MTLFGLNIVTTNAASKPEDIPRGRYSFDRNIPTYQCLPIQRLYMSGNP